MDTVVFPTLSSPLHILWAMDTPLPTSFSDWCLEIRPLLAVGLSQEAVEAELHRRRFVLNNERLRREVLAEVDDGAVDVFGQMTPPPHPSMP